MLERTRLVDNRSLGSELGQDVCRNVVIPRDVMELQIVEFGFKLPDLPAIGAHLLLGALPVFVDLLCVDMLCDDFGVTIS